MCRHYSPPALDPRPQPYRYDGWRSGGGESVGDDDDDASDNEDVFVLRDAEEHGERYASHRAMDSPTAYDAGPGRHGGDGEVLADEEGEEPAGLDHVDETADAAHHAEHEGVELEVLHAIDGNHRVEDAEHPFVAELADDRDHDQVVHCELRVLHSLHF